MSSAFLPDGESWALGQLFRGDTRTTSLFVGLVTVTPTDSSTLATITEVTGGSYARQALTLDTTGFPSAPSLVSGEEQLSSRTVTFPAPTANWGVITDVILCSVSTGTSGLLIANFTLASTLTVNSGDPAPAFVLPIRAS